MVSRDPTSGSTPECRGGAHDEYVLDGILDNHNDLRIEEHTTDTAGYTDLVFGLFELLGLRFSPRVRDIADHRLWRIGPLDHHQHASTGLDYFSDGLAPASRTQ